MTKEDRRVRRTRKLLRDAFMALLSEKEYEAITVQDIIEKADVARSTFYAHYLDKKDLLLGNKGIFSGDIDHDWRTQFVIEAEATSESILPTYVLFFHVQAQRHIFKVLIGDSSIDLATQQLYKILRENVQRRLEPHLHDNQTMSMPASMLLDYLASALLALMKWWLENDAADSPEEMDALFQKLVMPGVYNMLGIAM